MFENSSSWQRFKSEKTSPLRGHMGYVPELDSHEDEERKGLRTAMALAVIAHLIFFVLNWPEFSGKTYQIGSQDPVYVVQQIRFLAEGRLLGGTKRGMLQTHSDEYSLGEVVNVTARLFNSRYEPLRVDEVRADFVVERERQADIKKLTSEYSGMDKVVQKIEKRMESIKKQMEGQTSEVKKQSQLQLDNMNRQQATIMRGQTDIAGSLHNKGIGLDGNKISQNLHHVRVISRQGPAVSN